MPLGATLIGRKAGVVFTRCERLPGGPGYVEVPLPGAGLFKCPSRCGGPCEFLAASAAIGPPPCVSAEAMAASIRLAEARMVADQQRLVRAATLPPPPLVHDCLRAPGVLPGTPDATAPRKALAAQAIPWN